MNIPAGTSVIASDDEGREKLCRYITQPPVALERFERLRDGRIAFKVKYPTATGGTHRVMTPLALMARLAAIVPPPRFPTLT